MSRSTSSPTDSTGLPVDGLTLAAFLLMVLVGGSNAVAVRFSNSELPPFWGAAFRFSAAALIFWAVLLSRRLPLPRGRALAGGVVYGALSIGATYAFIYWGLLQIHAGLAMTVLALGPLLTLLLASAHRLEPFKWSGLAGALTALAGIALAIGQNLGSTVPLMSLLALVAGAACGAEASVVYKLFPRSDPLATNAIATTTGAVILALVSLVAREPWFLPAAAPTWAAFGYLVVIGSVVLFYLYLFVLSRWTATATSYAFLLFPVAATIISAWLTDEVVTPRFIFGGLIVLGGVWIGAVRPSGKPAPAQEPPREAGTAPAVPPRPGCA